MPAASLRPALLLAALAACAGFAPQLRTPSRGPLLRAAAAAAAEADPELADETARRRNLAIIAHPDAGKTTLTEQLLLFGDAIREAGAVRARSNQKRSTSDFMAMERERGACSLRCATSCHY